MIYAGRPIPASAVAEPQDNGYRRPSTDAAACRRDTYHMRRRRAKSFVDDLVLSRGVVLSRAELFCDLLRLSPMTRRFVRFRRTYLPLLLRWLAVRACRWESVGTRRSKRCDATTPTASRMDSFNFFHFSLVSRNSFNSPPSCPLTT